jgi:hypothetical protein
MGASSLPKRRKLPIRYICEYQRERVRSPYGGEVGSDVGGRGAKEHDHVHDP